MTDPATDQRDAREHPPARSLLRRLLRGAGAMLLVLVLTLLLSEAVVELLLRAPRLVPDAALENLRADYLEHDRAIVQFLPECSRWDDELVYTLLPGTCRFRNREFDVSLEINALGLRDDAASLEAPEIVVLGDSFAMGWGVEQEESFAEHLEQALRRRVLNAGISSYGTMREMRLLERIDRSALRVLVVQYNENDRSENAHFRKHGWSLPIDRARYEELTAEQQERGYALGAHLLHLSRAALENLRTDRAADLAAARALRSTADFADVEARLFLAVLEASPVDLRGVDVVVFESNAYGLNDSAFTDALRRRVEAGETAGTARSVRVLDLSARLGPQVYFRLDDHLRPEGHRIVAEELLALLDPPS